MKCMLSLETGEGMRILSRYPTGAAAKSITSAPCLGLKYGVVGLDCKKVASYPLERLANCMDGEVLGAGLWVSVWLLRDDPPLPGYTYCHEQLCADRLQLPFDGDTINHPLNTCFDDIAP